MDNKYYGLGSVYQLVSDQGSCVIIRYGYAPEPDDIHATWYEIYFYKKQHPVITLDEIKEAILADINSQTDEKILSGFIWNNKPVWLSSENQFNFKAAYDLAVQTQGQNLPVKFKLGETEVDEGFDEYGMPVRRKEPVYHVFTDMAEFTDFYTSAIAFISACLNEGWERKDSIDWNVYAERL